MWSINAARYTLAARPSCTLPHAAGQAHRVTLILLGFITTRLIFGNWYLFTGVIRYDAKVDASRDAMEKRR
jgi:hypothetical protein